MENNKKSLINRILLVILLFLIVILVIVYQFGYKPYIEEENRIPTAEEIAENYMIALINKDYDDVKQYLDFNGVLSYISLYNSWSYNIADEWNQIYELSKNSDIFDNMKEEVENYFSEEISNIDLEMNNTKLTLLQNAKKIDGTDNLYKVVINVLYKNEGYNYDDEIYLVKIKDTYYIVASNFIEDLATSCTYSLITEEYTIKNSLEQAISYIESENGILTRASLNKNIYDFRFCTKDSASKDLTVYSDNKELKDGDKIYLADLYVDDNANYYEVTLNIKDGHMIVGEINCIEK